MWSIIHPAYSLLVLFFHSNEVNAEIHNSLEVNVTDNMKYSASKAKDLNNVHEIDEDQLDDDYDDDDYDDYSDDDDDDDKLDDDDDDDEWDDDESVDEVYSPDHRIIPPANLKAPRKPNKQN